MNPGYTSIRDTRSKVVDARIEPASFLREGPKGVSYRVDRSVHEPGHHEVMGFPDLRQKRERKGPTATCKGSTSATSSMTDVWGVIR